MRLFVWFCCHFVITTLPARCAAVAHADPTYYTRLNYPHYRTRCLHACRVYTLRCAMRTYTRVYYVWFIRTPFRSRFPRPDAHCNAPRLPVARCLRGLITGRFCSFTRCLTHSGLRYTYVTALRLVTLPCRCPHAHLPHGLEPLVGWTDAAAVQRYLCYTLHHPTLLPWFSLPVALRFFAFVVACTLYAPLYVVYAYVLAFCVCATSRLHSLWTARAGALRFCFTRCRTPCPTQYYSP